MWHVAQFVVGVGEGPRSHGGGDADDGGGCEGRMAEECMGCGGDTGNGGMSEGHVGMWAHGKGCVGNVDDGSRCEECMDNRVCKTSTSQYPIFCVDLPACQQCIRRDM